ncbi:hypothetical protein HID58_078366 [Brassica napus]|uniref:Uncharacterized protein n=1 Tax=Brassica napus TaxID=3708 RepID=A0ABQ7YTU4_BRANA|nr:hypothetical protein HID58_078366 [Brassica napus]
MRSDAAPPPFKCDCSGSGKLGTSGGDEFMGVDMLLLDSQKNSRKQCSVRSQATTLIYKNVEAYQVVDCKWKQKDFGNFVKLNYRSRGSRLLAIKTLNWIGLSWQHL